MQSRASSSPSNPSHPRENDATVGANPNLHNIANSNSLFNSSAPTSFFCLIGIVFSELTNEELKGFLRRICISK